MERLQKFMARSGIASRRKCEEYIAAGFVTVNGTPVTELGTQIDPEKDEILFTNGSDDILNFAFMAFCDSGAVYPDITYGFYPVFAQFNGIDAEEIPLREDFTVNVSDLLVLLCAVGFTVHILVIDHFTQFVNGIIFQPTNNAESVAQR